jgi:hypothetical protein
VKCHPIYRKAATSASGHKQALVILAVQRLVTATSRRSVRNVVIYKLADVGVKE